MYIAEKFFSVDIVVRDSGWYVHYKHQEFIDILLLWHRMRIDSMRVIVGLVFDLHIPNSKHLERELSSL